MNSKLVKANQIEIRKSTDEKMIDELEKYKKYCKCGHSVIMPPTSKKNKVICSWCGSWIYKNNLEEFKDKLNKNIIKEEKSDSHKS